mmetsp:Transcript_12518/g.24955  ORF Transcript_12518/g.24955 Transcript_12518/m.24955 type:complete len:236 (+) Transcript_12518:448-1155(+)
MASGKAASSTPTTSADALYLAASCRGVLALRFRTCAASGCVPRSARTTSTDDWDWAARWSGRCPRWVVVEGPAGFRAASARMRRGVAWTFCAATCRGVRRRRSWAAAASGLPRARTLWREEETEGWAAAMWRGVAPKLFARVVARTADGEPRMRIWETGDGASKTAQACRGVNISSLVVPRLSGPASTSRRSTSSSRSPMTAVPVLFPPTRFFRLQHARCSGVSPTFEPAVAPAG